MKKRLLSLILAAVLVYALLPMSVAAAGITVTEIVPCKYDEVRDFHEGLAAVCVGQSVNAKWGFVDTTGKEVVPCKYARVEDYHRGLALVKMGYDQYGCIDKTGREVIPCKCSRIPIFFEDGLIRAQFDDKTVYIDWLGREVSYSKYKEVLPFSEGLAAVKDEYNRWGFIDETDTEVISCQYANTSSFSEGLAAVGKRTGERTPTSTPIYQWGFIDKTGEEVVPCTLKCGYVGGLHEGFAQVADVEHVTVYGAIDPSTSIPVRKTGFIDATGKEIVPCKYDIAEDFDGGLAAVGIFAYKAGMDTVYLWGFIDTQGNEVVPCKYHADKTAAPKFSEDGLARGYYYDSEGHFCAGYFDRTGKEIANGYDAGTVFNKGLAWVERDKLWGCIDKTGAEVIPCKYRMNPGPYTFPECLHAAGINDGDKWGFIDETGKEVIPFQYEGASDFSEGLAVVMKNGTRILIDKTGAEVLYIEDGVSIDVLSNGLIALGKVVDVVDEGVTFQDTRYRLIDATGREIIPYKYNEIVPFKEGCLRIGLRDKQGQTKYGFLRIDGYNTSYPSTQSVLVDGAPVEFQCYALKDANGNDTNYIKLRDVASVLNGTAVQFNVGWDGAVNIETGKGYTPNGSEMNTPFYGDRAYENATAETRINGKAASLDAIVLKDDQGGAYTYYKLRDLGAALGFKVDWTAEKGIFIETK